MAEDKAVRVDIDITVTGTKSDRELRATFVSVDDAYNAVEEFFEHYAPHP